MSARRTPRREIALVVGILLLAGSIVYGPHVFEGGFTIDDWSHAATAARPPENLLTHYWSFTSNRPVLVGYVPLTHLVFGTDSGLHNAWSIVLAVAMSTALYAVLRQLSTPPLHAAAISLLVLLFPWSDATRFWATASHISLSIGLGLTGLLLALRGLDNRAAERHRAGVALHACALTLYALSVLTYEIAGVVLLFVGALYLTRADWKAVRVRWGADILVILPCLAWSGLRADRERPSLAEMLDHAEAIADGGATVLALSAVPFGSIGRMAILGALALIIVAAIVARGLQRKGEMRLVLSRWVLMAGAGLLIAIAGWVLYIPADPYYNPSSPGVGNRVNAMAAIGLVILVYAAIVLLTTLISRWAPQRQRVATALAALLAALLAVGYADRSRNDQQAWARASVAVDAVLATVRHALPDPPPGSIIYTFGYPGSERPGILIFGFTWDLHGAVRLAYDDPTLAAYPVLTGTTINCLESGIKPTGTGWTSPLHDAPYNRAFFVDIPTATAKAIDSRRQCLAALDRFHPGPVTRPP